MGNLRNIGDGVEGDREIGLGEQRLRERWSIGRFEGRVVEG